MVDPSCSIRGFHFEDILYILRDSTTTKDVWSQVITGSHSLNFYSMNLHDWILSKVRDIFVIHEGGTVWACLFGIII